MAILAAAVETLLRKLLRIATVPGGRPSVLLLNMAARVYFDGFDMRHFVVNETLVSMGGGGVVQLPVLHPFRALSCPPSTALSYRLSGGTFDVAPPSTLGP